MANPTQRFLLSLVLLPALIPAKLQASDLENLLGVWGNDAQCSQSLITPKGTKSHAPFELGNDWLGHGDIWCRLTWRATDSTPNGISAFAYAQCGEDSVRNYEIKFNLDGEELNIIWNIFHKNGPLLRCNL